MGSTPEPPVASRLFDGDEFLTDEPQTDLSYHWFGHQQKALKSVSVVVPVLNEADNLRALCRQVFFALEPTGRTFELILVDDGSNDDSDRVLRELVGNASPANPVRAILLAGNFGQTAALKAGIDAANGDYVVTLDGDLQNDPADIPMMLDRLDTGFEIVFGWRKQRQDHLWTRKIPSQIANALIRRVTGTQVRDLGCALKAMTRDLASRLELVGDMHRFIAVLATHLKAKSCEVPTGHRARVHGKTKYGLGRIKRVVLDLLVLKVLEHRHHPMRFFGGWALGLAGCATACFLASGCFAIFAQPQWALILAAGLGGLLGVVGLQLGSIGLLAELMVRREACSDTYKTKATCYRVREILGPTLAVRRGRQIA